VSQIVGALVKHTLTVTDCVFRHVRTAVFGLTVSPTFGVALVHLK